MSGLLALLILTIALMAAVPPVSRDALTHHLALPKIWIADNGIHETPEIPFSYYPMNLDLLYTVPLMFGNDILPKYIHMLFGLATAYLIYVHLSISLQRIYALAGVLLFVSLPVIVKLSITAYVDLGLVFFSTAALILLLAWQRRGLQKRYLLLAGICCGMALGTKYNGLAVFIILVLMVPYISVKTGRICSGDGHVKVTSVHVIGNVAMFVIVALLVFSPWGVRNFIWTGNPLYPLYNELFNPNAAAVENSLHPFVIRKLIYGESLLKTLLIPVRIFFHGQDDVPAFFDGRLNPYLFFLPLCGMLKGQRESRLARVEKNVLAAFSLMVILIVFFTRDMRIRYIIPAVPSLVMLSVYGLNNIFERLNRIRSLATRYSLGAGVAFLMLCAIGANGIYIMALFAKVRPIDYLNGRLSRDAYIEIFRPEYAAVQYANHNLAIDDRALCLFLGNRRYYFDVNTLFYDWPKFKSMVESSIDAAELSKQFQRQGISHLVIGWHQFQEWMQRTMAEKDRVKVSAFLTSELFMLFQKNGYVVLRFQ